MPKNDLQLGFLEAKRITQNYAKTFFLASLFLPKKKRLASYAIYAICRISDESVDEKNSIQKAEALNKIKSRIHAAYSSEKLNDKLLLCFRSTVNTFNIPEEYFNQLIEGMQMDLTKSRYQNFQELYSYCYRAAGIVGLIMLKIFDAKKNLAVSFAVDLGIAMQLTNILRDVDEDYQRKRIYLPLSELEKFMVTEKDIENKNNNSNFKALITAQIDRCKEYYNQSKKGIRLIPGLREKFVVIVMREMYSAILNEIEKNAFDVFTRRAQVNLLKKIAILLRILIRGEYLCV